MRKANPQWTDPKLKVVEVESLDVLEDTAKWQFPGFHSLFCVLGTRVKVGKEAFVKVDYTYPILGGKIVKANEIPHYSLLSSVGADEKSFFLYNKTKGRTENELRKMDFNALSIFRPGLLTHRDGEYRLGERIAAYIPFMPKIKACQLAAAMRTESELLSERVNLKAEKEISVYTNSQIKSIIS